MNFTLLLATAVGASILTFGSGFILLRALTNFSNTECWAFSGGAGCALFALIAFGAFLTHQFHRLFYVIPLLAILLLCIGILKLRKISLTIKRPPFWVVYVLIFWVLLVSFQCLTPVYTRAFLYGDWWMHYDVAQFYLGLRPLDIQYFGVFSIPSRTPLFNLFASFFLAIFDNHFAVYQMVTLLPGIALVGATLIFVPTQKTTLKLGLFFLNPFLVTMMLYPWPKALATTYIISGLYFYRQWQIKPPARSGKSFILASGFWQGLAILTHPSAIFYTLGMFIDKVFQRRSRSIRINNYLLAVLPFGFVVFPWFLWVVRQYGLASLWQATPTIAAGGNSFYLTRLMERALNMLGTLLPLPAFLALESRLWEPKLWLDIWLRFYYGVLPGACTITVILILRKFLRQKSETVQALPLRTFGIVTLIGFTCGFVFQPGLNPKGLVGESMMPIVVIALILAAHIMEALTSGQQRVIMLFVSLEFFASRGIQTLVDVVRAIPASDPNMLLKQEYHLLFAQDLVGHSSILVFLIVVGYAFLLWMFLRDGGRQTGDSVTH
jgi:hypothetical protein